MKQFNVKHVFDGKLTPLSLGEMSISAALFTAYRLQDDDSFTITTLIIGKHRYSAVNIALTPLFFEHDYKTDNLTLVKDIEKELVRVTEGKEHVCQVIVNKEIGEYNVVIDNVVSKIHDESIFNDMIEELIDGEEHKEKEPRIEHNRDKEDIEEIEDIGEYEKEIKFKNIPVFDDNEHFYLDTEIEKVADLLDDILDIDEEISELITMAQEMLSEASYISKNGESPYNEYTVGLDEIFDADDEDAYWDLTLEEEDELGINQESRRKESINYIDKEVSKMSPSKNEPVDNAFEERMDNFLEFMLSQSSHGYEPKYKYKYTTKGRLENYSDKHGSFTIPDVDNFTKFSPENHIILLEITRTSVETGEETVTLEESDLLDDFTIDEVLKEVATNSKHLKNTTAKLYSMQTKDGDVIWKSKGYKEDK